MPYIKESERERIEKEIRRYPQLKTPGELNYFITEVIRTYLDKKIFDQREANNYADFNEVIGVLECAKQELYRRLVAPYEDVKMIENGDVY